MFSIGLGIFRKYIFHLVLAGKSLERKPEISIILWRIDVLWYSIKIQFFLFKSMNFSHAERERWYNW